MNKIVLFAVAVMACGNIYADGKAHFTGNITGQGDHDVIIIQYEGHDMHTDTLQLDKQGNFDVTINVKNPNHAYFFIDDLKLSKNMYVEDGIKANIQAKVVKTADKEALYQLELTYTGDNADCYEYIQKHDMFEDFNDWPWERLKKTSFRDFRAEYLAAIDARKVELSKVKSLNFRRERYAMLKSEERPQLARFLWADREQQDPDAVNWLLSYDHNDPENISDADMYWRWYMENNKTKPGQSRLTQLKEAFTNQEVINAFADDLVIQWLQGAPEDMDQLLADYEKVSTNPEGHKKAEEVYNHYKKLKKGMPSVDFTFSDKDGKQYSLKDFRGKALYIDVWATWCGPCCGEIPYMAKLVEHYKGDKRINLISISFDDNKAKWLKKLAADKAEHPKWAKWAQYICPENFKSTLCTEYDIHGIPRFLMFDKEGNIISLDAPRPSADNIISWIEENLK